MAGNERTPATIDEYIERFPEDIQTQLGILRETIRQAAPGAAEKISWGMPAFSLGGDLVYFAAHKRHIGFYPGAALREEFTEDLKPYRTSKGGVQFPYGQPLPLGLIRRIVLYRIEENIRVTADREAARAAAKAATKAERARKKEM
jgi:uncharacterized protein YdhG (YjbR/CyaY superfamily)